VVLVDTNVWSLLFRKQGPASVPEVAALRRFLNSEEPVATTGIIAQELFFGLGDSEQAAAFAAQFEALYYLSPTLNQHIEAAKLARALRKQGVQMSLPDALIAQVALDRDLLLLTTDQDFKHAKRFLPLRLWTENA